ncbi:hypothetical protein [Mycobacterium lepromatosis]|uniref:hypothetical protein n=1 Tax=Mycobacterium lepromatosis TaxID=480418 RepID=UPI0012E02EFA|nr:hypothetical protein [Mycobacterium lepromatosis]
MGLCVPHAVGRTEPDTPPCCASGVRYRHVTAGLDSVLPYEADIVVDADKTGASVVYYLLVRCDGRFAVDLGMGFIVTV